MKFLILILLLANVTFADEELEKIEVIEQGQSNVSEFWEENKQTQIYSGKKNTITSLKEIPQLQTNNYRQATSQTPGLLISEIPNESLAAITYRGLGDPHESFNILMLQDGIPVAADMYGYPAHYFSPALPMMEKVQFIRGGASLLYGPQPGGALNYISRPLTKEQKTSGRVGLTGGSYNLLSTNNALYGHSKNKSYGIEYHRRQGDGIQRENADFYADYLQARQNYYLEGSVFKVAFNGYNSDHGNPGGFSKSPSTGFNAYGEDERQATREHDRLKVSRAQLSGALEKKIDSSSQISLALWGTAYRRYSKTQNGGGFGKIPTGTSNAIVTQNYYGYNADLRYLKNYGEHTLSAGYLNYNLLSPYVGETGAAVDSNHGDVTKRFERSTHTNSFYVENRFGFGKLLVTPGVRLENIRQVIDERKNTSSTDLRYDDKTQNVPLFGIGASYHATENSQIYANISEAYKPVTYQESVPVTTTSISEDIDPADIITYELGYRGQTPKFNWDASLFFIRYENKFGQVGNVYQNTGAGTSKGIDLSGELKAFGDFNLYGNVEVLNAVFTKGPLKDKTPQYAPNTITRTGIIYNKEDKLKAALMGVMVSKHFGDDGNTSNFEIPSYVVFDLTADWKFHKDWLANAGINNLLDRDYYSRVRSDGIVWAMGRNVYLGATYQF
jgi:Fe(3+) dicitrate transport protein